MKNFGLTISGALLLAAGFLFGLSYTNMQQKDLTNLDIKTETSNSLKVRSFVPESLAEAEKSIINLFDTSVPSVVYITTTNLERNYWNRNVTEIPRGSGSGFIWDTDGHIVTNYHVIQGADKATVTMYDQTSYEAELVGVAPDKDLAVLKIIAPKDKFIAISKGNSEGLRVGQSVLAIGNPFGLDYTLTTGVISALGREINSTNEIKIKDVIQTDAAINPGNSGGPLLNSNGELIGVNTAIYSPSGAYAGIGFSIPVDEVKSAVPDLIQYGKIRRPVLGVELLPGNTAQERLGLSGALIMNIIEGKGAEAAGLKATTRSRNGQIVLGDLIVGVNGVKISNNSDLVLALEDYKPGDIVDIEFIRNDKKEGRQVKLSEN